MAFAFSNNFRNGRNDGWTDTASSSDTRTHLKRHVQFRLGLCRSSYKYQIVIIQQSMTPMKIKPVKWNHRWNLHLSFSETGAGCHRGFDTIRPIIWHFLIKHRPPWMVKKSVKECDGLIESNIWCTCKILNVHSLNNLYFNLIVKTRILLRLLRKTSLI